jgi:hypothetical protein
MPRLGSLPQKNLIATGANTAGYDSFTLNSTSYNEGATITATLLGNTIANGTKVNYTVTGISAGDLSSGSLTGQLNIVANTASVQWTLSNDSTSEGAETFTVTLDNYDSRGDFTGGLSDSATINDTSKQIAYAISSFSDTTPNEGTTVNVSYYVTNSTQTLYWTIDGTTADFGSVSGSSNYASTNVVGFDTQYIHNVSFTIDADAITEGNEAYTFSLRTGSTSGTVRATQAFTVQDTSVYQYDIQFMSGSPFLQEGNPNGYTFRFRSTSPETLYWRIQAIPSNTLAGANEFNARTGSSDYTSSTTSGGVTYYTHDNVTILALQDGVNEFGTEQFLLQCRTGSTSGTIRDQVSLFIQGNTT